MKCATCGTIRLDHVSLRAELITLLEDYLEGTDPGYLRRKAHNLLQHPMTDTLKRACERLASMSLKEPEARRILRGLQ